MRHALDLTLRCTARGKIEEILRFAALRSSALPYVAVSGHYPHFFEAFSGFRIFVYVEGKALVFLLLQRKDHQSKIFSSPNDLTKKDVTFLIVETR